MRALLVIDMPRDCWDCHLVDEWGNCNAIKMTSARYGVSVKQNDKDRPSWCPLKDLPSNKEIKGDWENVVDVWVDGANYGYNKCLNDISGEKK